MTGKGWVAAGDLIVGDEIYALSGDTGTVTGLRLEKTGNPIPVYNIEVEDFQSYFVGDGVLVHNRCKRDLGQVDKAAKEVGVDRKLLGELIHEIKDEYGMKQGDNFSYKELIEFAKELIGKKESRHLMGSDINDDFVLTGEFVLSIIEPDDAASEENFKKSFDTVAFVRKGQSIVSRMTTKKNAWSYIVKFNSDMDFTERLREFIDKILINIDFINELKSRSEEIRVKAFIRSDYAQMGWDIQSGILCDLAKLDIDLEFHIFSFGMVPYE